MSNYCIVCDSTEASSMYKGIVKCKECGYVYANLDMTQDEFDRLHDEHHGTGQSPSKPTTPEPTAQNNVEEQSAQLQEDINDYVVPNAVST